MKDNQTTTDQTTYTDPGPAPNLLQQQQLAQIYGISVRKVQRQYEDFYHITHEDARPKKKPVLIDCCSCVPMSAAINLLMIFEIFTMIFMIGMVIFLS